MKYTHNQSQISLFNFSTMGFNLEDTSLAKLERAVPWDEVIASVGTLYANNGRNSNSIRIMIGLEMGKTYYQVSDETIVGMLKSNTELMVLCGFDRPPISKEIPVSNSMTDFRNRLTKEVLDEISSTVIQNEIIKLSSRKRTQVASDTTCIKADITFPTDVKILTATTKHLVKVAKQIRVNGKEFVIRGKQTIKKTINSYNKKRKHTKEELKELLTTLVNFNEDLHKQLKSKYTQFTKKQKDNLQKASNIIQQQKEMLEKEVRTIEERIVSFHEQKLRPIYRGKYPQPTEFGKKTSIMVIGGALAIHAESEFNNFSDSKVTKKDIERFKETTSRDIKEYSADRGYHSKENHELLEIEGIVDGIAYKGKKPQKAKGKISKVTQIRLSNQRQPSEGKLGTLKTRYGCEKPPYKADNIDVRVGMACIMHNLNWGIQQGG